MKGIFAILLVALISAGGIQIGRPAPNFKKSNVDGNTIDLESYRGNKNVLLVFSRYIGCSYCQMFIIDLLKRSDDLKAANTEVIIVTNSDMQTAGRYEPPQKMPFLLIPDPGMELYKLYGVKSKGRMFSWNVAKKSAAFLKYLPRYRWVKKGLEGDHYQAPACFIIDATGIVRYSHIGKDVADNPQSAEIMIVLKSLNQPH